MAFSLDLLAELVREQRPNVSIGYGEVIIDEQRHRYLAFESLVGMCPMRVVVTSTHVVVNVGSGHLAKPLSDATEQELVVHIVDYVTGRQEIN